MSNSSRREATPLKRALLFVLHTGGNNTINVTGTKVITITIPEADSTFKYFFDIPFHTSGNLGRASIGRTLLMSSSTNRVALPDDHDGVAEIVNSQSTSLLSKRPNCSISLMTSDSSALTVVTVAILTGWSINPNNSSSQLTFTIQDSEPGITTGSYSFVSITVDSLSEDGYSLHDTWLTDNEFRDFAFGSNDVKGSFSLGSNMPAPD